MNMEKKKCIGCNVEFELNNDNFYRKNKKYEGFQSRCKKCFCEQTKKNQQGENFKKYLKEYYIKNKEKLNKQQIKNYNRNKEEINQKNLEKYYNNREYYLNIQKQYQDKVKSDPIKLEKHREYVRNFQKEYYHKNKYKGLIRNQLNNIKLLLGTEKIYPSLKELKYTPLEFKIHIESGFKLNMNWENLGIGKDKWNIDHKVPITWFKQHTPFYLVNNLSNLEPIWWIDNVRKSNKYSTPISLEYFNLIKEYIRDEYLELVKTND